VGEEWANRWMWGLTVKGRENNGGSLDIDEIKRLQEERQGVLDQVNTMIFNVGEQFTGMDVKVHVTIPASFNALSGKTWEGTFGWGRLQTKSVDTWGLYYTGSDGSSHPLYSGSALVRKTFLESVPQLLEATKARLEEITSSNEKAISIAKDALGKFK